MKKLFATIALLFFSANPALAVTGDTLEQQEHLTAVITGPDDIAVGRTLVLDASSSSGLGERTTYRWYRDGLGLPISKTVEAVYTPERPGVTIIRLVVSTLIDGERQESEVQKAITVYDRKIVMVADATIPAEKLQLHRQAATNAGVYLRVMQPSESAIPISTEESLFNVIKEKNAALAGADSIVLWTEGINGLQALMRATEGDEEREQGIKNQTVVLITDRSLNTLSRTARGPFSVLQPDQILVTRKEALNPLLSAEDIEKFIVEMEQRDIDFEVVDETTTAVRPWNLLSSLVNYMLTHGVASQTVTLLLMLPIIAMILAFLKQVIGITTFGLYTPSIVALSFLALGWKVGLLFLLFILITGYVTRTLMRRWRLLYIPKVAIILTVVSITLLLLLGIGAYYDITLSGDTIFVLLIMSTLAESLLNVKAEEGWYSAVIAIGETILAAILCVMIVQWSLLQSMILAFPELILLTIIVNIFLGRWTGLRLVEYFRFREVFKHLQEE